MPSIKPRLQGNTAPVSRGEGAAAPAAGARRSTVLNANGTGLTALGRSSSNAPRPRQMTLPGQVARSGLDNGGGQSLDPRPASARPIVNPVSPFASDLSVPAAAKA